MNRARPLSGRAPATLRAQAEQYANDEHSRRLAELEELAPLLARLDELRPALAERGCEFYPNSFGLQREQLDGGFIGGPRHKVLRVRSYFQHSNPTRSTWCIALQALGFTLVRPVNATSCCPTALFRRQHLLLEIDLSPADVEALRPAPAPSPASATTEAL